MKKRQVIFGAAVILPLAVLAAGPGQAPPSGQALPPNPSVNISVRVVDGNRFVEDLSVADFAVFEDLGAVQPTSLALVKKGSIVRFEGPKALAPDTARTYYLMFQTVDWDPKLSDAVDYLFSSVLYPGDSMTLITPWKPYALNKDALAKQPPDKLSQSMQDILKKDIQRGGGQYRELTRELIRLTRSIAGVRTGATSDIEENPESEANLGFSIESQFEHYRNALMTFESLRLVDEKRLLAFANLAKSIPGQKIVYLFYAREYRPEINPKSLQSLMSLYQDNPTVLSGVMELFQLYQHETQFNAERVKQAFADAGIVFHFIFMEKKTQRVAGAYMREQSEDIFPGFRDIAAATGGVTEVSQNVAKAFERAVKESETYYLLSYAPPSSGGGGAFRRVRVEVKRPGASYAVVNQLGYFSR